MLRTRDRWNIACAVVVAVALATPAWGQVGGNPLNGVQTRGISIKTVEAESGGAPSYEISLRLDSDPRTVIADLAGSPIRDQITRISYSLNFANAAARARPALDLAGIERLASLRELRLDQARVTGIESLASAPSLRVLDLDRLPAFDTEALQGLTGIEDLTLYTEEAASVAPLRSMTALRRLKLGLRAFGDLETLAELPNLKHLEIYQPREGALTSFEPVAALPQIKSLALTGLGVWPTDMAPIARLENLESLQTYLFGNYHVIARMDGLRRLHLDVAGSSDLSFLASTTQLEELRLIVRDSPFVLSWLSGYADLHIFDLWIDSKDADTDAEGLRGLSTLEELSLVYIDSADEMDLSVIGALAGLRSLTLSGIRSDDYSPLARLQGLEELDLSNSDLNNLDLVAAMAGLRELDVVRTHVDDISPLAGLRRLETLKLAETRVRRLDALAEIDSLRSVDVRDTPIRDYRVLEGMPRVRWEPPARRGGALRAMLSDRTVHTYDSDFGNQIEYSSDDGRTYLWFPGNDQVLEGAWRVRGDQVCYRYAENTYDPFTGASGGSWQCTWSGAWVRGLRQSWDGDIYGLADSATPPTELSGFGDIPPPPRTRDIGE